MTCKKLLALLCAFMMMMSIPVASAENTGDFASFTRIPNSLYYKGGVVMRGFVKGADTASLPLELAYVLTSMPYIILGQKTTWEVTISGGEGPYMCEAVLAYQEFSKRPFEDSWGVPDWFDVEDGSFDYTFTKEGRYFWEFRVMDENGQFFSDNGERAIFFARGVLETVKKLRWAPDVIHCQGWISHVLPLYLKKAYIDDPIFSNSKVVLSLYNDAPGASFPADIKEKILYGGVTEKDVEILSEPSGINLAKLAASWSDGIIMGSEDIDASLMDFCKDSGLPILPFNAGSIQDGTYINDYNSFYDNL